MPTNETYLGSALSGTTGQSNRVLTLSNTSLTVAGGFQVFVNGVYKTLTTDYTTSHLATSSTVTFLGAIADTDSITVIYYIQGEVPSGTYKYTTANDVYARTGLSVSEIDFTSGNNSIVIEDAEAELEALTGRKFTNANTKTEYIDGPDKDVLGISGQKAISINSSEYPIQSITELKLLYVDGTVSKTYDTLSAAEITAGTYDSADYWAETIEDPLTHTIIPYGKITLKTDNFPVGRRNVKVSYTYGYPTVPAIIRNLASCMAGIRAWIRFLGGNYNRVDSYTIPQQTVSKGSFYIRGRANIRVLQEEVDRILDRVGRRPLTLFASSVSIR